MRTRLASVFTLCLAATAVVAACGKKASGGTSRGSSVLVTEVDLGRSLKSDLMIDDKTDTFKPNDVIYASVATRGTGPATLTARWTYQDDQLVSESSKTISPQEPARTEFHISKPDGFPEGKYRLVISLNGASAETKEFEVKK